MATVHITPCTACQVLERREKNIKYCLNALFKRSINEVSKTHQDKQ